MNDHLLAKEKVSLVCSSILLCDNCGKTIAIVSQANCTDEHRVWSENFVGEKSNVIKFVKP